MVLNEPETSLHPDLLAPLSRLVRQAAARTQVVVVSHAEQLIAELAPERWPDADAPPDHDGSVAGRVHLDKDLGETRVEGQGLLSTPAWAWGSR